MSLTHMQLGEAIDVRPLGAADTKTPPRKAGGEIVVQCLEGEVAITASAKTQNLHAGELLYLSAGEPHSLKGVEHASVLLSIEDPEPNRPEENETIHARGMLLSVMQAVVLVISLALLFIAVAGNIFGGVLVIGAVLVIFGCLHYWLWGRWMSPSVAQVRAPSPSSRQ